MQLGTKADRKPDMGQPVDRELDELWSNFVDPSSSHEFYSAWLALQCSAIEKVRAGLLLQRRANGRFAPAAIWPTPLHDVKYLSAAAQQAVTQKRGFFQTADDNSGTVIGYPLVTSDVVNGVIVLDIADISALQLRDVMRRLHWGSGWLESRLWQDRSQTFEQKLDRSAIALDLLVVAEKQNTFDGSVLSLVNELATRFECDRVTIGIVRRETVYLRAMSNSTFFSKKADVVGAIETAMQEAFDQSGTVCHPAIQNLEPRLTIAHLQLVERFGGKYVASVILPGQIGSFGVMTIERRSNPFDAETLAILELMAGLCGPVLALKAKSERWVAGRIVDFLATQAQRLVGPNRPALKIGTAAALIAIATLGLIHEDFRIPAKAVLEGSVQRAAVAPFEGYIKEAPARAGDVVKEGQILAQLSDRDLKLDQLKWQSERDKLLQKHRDALAKHDRGGVIVAGAQLRQAEAQLSLASEKMSRTNVVAPIAGVVVSGDLSQMLGAPVEQGKVLFEIAPLDSYRVVLQVDEYDVGFIAMGQKGTMLLTGVSDAAIPLEVTKISSVSTPQDGRNYFRIEAALGDTQIRLRPGMEGVAKVTIDRRVSIWVWTRTTIERLRVFAWNWLP